jgi:hypothetical protein
MQRLQMQDLFTSSAGTRASNSAGIFTDAHQHGPLYALSVQS